MAPDYSGNTTGNSFYLTTAGNTGITSDCATGLNLCSADTVWRTSVDPSLGDMRYNYETKSQEVWDGNEWVQLSPESEPDMELSRLRSKVLGFSF